MQNTQIESILAENLHLCRELHNLLLEENRIMRTQEAPPDNHFLERKREFLPLLIENIRRLHMVNESDPSFTPEQKEAVQQGRRKLLQLLMLDRENERLLLKSSLPPNLRQAYQAATPGQAARAYEKHTGREVK